ncbi:thioredoxin family protein [Akkermansiaceae bacterium]|nr:thioredoxin family protein [Akkermansiaceae bacterium]MDA7611539.1 thioredoxin family protein [bacterium]MDA7517736.1 thioredoxin family protein [Akkermansiaceae bacterium]MDA7518731.1 thioredoxin family protein [Akkermansiaceae bacterium]MDA7674830.1 thioredoxin family protein [Akkermansiaceae bacterium]
MMRHFRTIAAILLASASLATATVKGWTTDFEAAKAQAKKEGKSLLLDFTGSDWCPPCKALHKDVFSKKSFIDSAKKNFILVELDYPRKGDQSKELKAQNKELAKKYKIRAYPTVLLLDANGKVFKKVEGNPDFTVKSMNEMLKTSLSAKKFN